MKIRNYFNSQSGAALILILFVVIFLSIVGTVLLNSTTYSQKSIVNNSALEKEFYLAEGALDIVLNDIYNNPALYNELKMMDFTSYREMFESTLGNYKEIGSIPMSVKLKKISENTDSLTVELTAGYANNGKKDRGLEVEVLNPIGEVTSHTILYNDDDDPLDFSTNSGTHQLIVGADKEDFSYYENVYQSFYDYFIAGEDSIYTNLTQMDTFIGEDTIQGPVFIYNGSLELKTHENLTIKANNIVFINGTLYQKGQSIIDIEEGAILLVNNLKIGNGNNAQNIIDGALVVNSFSTQGQGQGIDMNVVIGENSGIKCDIINSIPGLSGVSGCGPITPQTKLQYKIEDYTTQ